MPNRPLETQASIEHPILRDIAERRLQIARVLSGATSVVLAASLVAEMGFSHHGDHGSTLTARSPIQIETQEHVDPGKELEEFLRRIRAGICQHTLPHAA